MRSRFFILCFCLVLPLLAACSINGQSPATPQASPTEEAVKLEPPTLTLVAPSGSQTGSLGAYFWALENGVAADITSGGFVIPSQTLTVERGAQLRIDVSGNKTPHALTVRIYPKDGNIKQAGTRDGLIDAFVPTTQPLKQFSLDPASPSWSVDLDPGEYFVWVKGDWQHPLWPTKPPTAQYAYLIQVRG